MEECVEKWGGLKVLIITNPDGTYTVDVCRDALINNKPVFTYFLMERTFDSLDETLKFVRDILYHQRIY